MVAGVRAWLRASAVVVCRAAVYRNPLLGDHNCWGEAKLEAIDLVAIADGATPACVIGH
jgi:hypothetical protein